MLKKIITPVIVLAMTAVQVFAEGFTDVSGHWAESEIAYARENGFANGYSDGSFRPDGEITRAEFAKLIVSSVCENLGIDTEIYADDSHWASEYYNFAVLSGMWTPSEELSYDGVSPGIFEGENYNYPIKRWEMAYILYGCLTNVFSANSEGGADYPDMEETRTRYGETVTGAIRTCIGEGLLTGDENGRFNAAKNGTRAQAVTIVNRVDRLIKNIMKELAEQTDAAQKLVDEKVKTYEAIPEGHPRVTVEIEGGKSFTIELYPEYAPQTVANFIELAKSGFYDGLKFHRVIDGFMAQGGDPNGDGTGGAEYNIFGEFAGNGFSANTLSHTRGVISMARGQFANSASSQFFICFADVPYLDGSYAAFGKVVEGMETVDSFLDSGLSMSSLGEMSVPNTDIVIKHMTVSE